MEPNKNGKFSKSILAIVMFLFLMGAIIGAVLVILSAVIDIRKSHGIDPQLFMIYTAYLGAPTGTAIGFYAWKSKAENILKIHYGNREKKDESECRDPELDLSILSNMGGNT